jgi:phosphatidylglycerol---prolipoprotein diacylglyceryl transferase
MSWIFFSAAALVAMAIGAWQVQRGGLSLLRAAWAVALAVGLGLVVGHWVSLAFHPERVVEQPELVFLLYRGGFSSFGVYGGAVLGLLVGTGSLFWAYADRLAPGLLIGAAVARTACLWNGCDFGRRGEAAWTWAQAPGTPAFKHQVNLGILDPHAAQALPTHPFALYEALPVLLVGLAALAFPQLFGRVTGRRAAGCAALYCAVRAVAEHWRGDVAPTFGITTMQLMCLGGLVAALLFFRGLADEPSQTLARGSDGDTRDRAHGLSGVRG